MGRGIEFDMAVGLGCMKEMISLSFRTFRRTECCLRDCEEALGYSEEFCSDGISLYKEAKGKIPEIGSKLSLELYGVAYREVYKWNEEDLKKQIFNINSMYCKKINHYKNIDECSLNDLRTLYETYNSDIIECIEKNDRQKHGYTVCYRYICFKTGKFIGRRKNRKIANYAGD